MNKVKKIFVPKDNVSDESYIVQDLLVKEGEKACKNTQIAILESSKGTVEIYPDDDGYIFFKAKEGDELKIGTVLAIQSDSHLRPDNFEVEEDEENVSTKENKFSKKALSLVKENNINPAVFNNLSLVRAEDVENYINKEKTPISKFKIIAQKIVIFGGGGMGKMVIDLIRQNGIYSIEGIIDENIPAGTEIMGCKVLGGINKLGELSNKGVKYATLAIGSIGNNSYREKIFNEIVNAGLNPVTLIHPTAIVETSAIIGEGTIVFAGAIIGSCVSIGSNCIINSGSIVSHDCIVEDGVHIAPGAILGGEVHVGKYSLIGMGVTIYIGVKIGSCSTIINGSRVMGNIPNGKIVN